MVGEGLLDCLSLRQAINRPFKKQRVPFRFFGDAANQRDCDGIVGIARRVFEWPQDVWMGFVASPIDLEQF